MVYKSFLNFNIIVQLKKSLARMLNDENLLTNESNVGTGNQQPIWKWILAVVFLVLVSLTTGSINLYPSQRDSIIKALDISSSAATFMLTGGVVIMYLTLPTGIFKDKFGVNITFWISGIITVVSYLILIFLTKPSGLFIFVYLLMGFGSSSLFFACLGIALDYSPEKIRGVSVSFVSASLSLSFGLFLEIFKKGKKTFKCKGEDCLFSGFQLVGTVVSVTLFISIPIAYYFYRLFYVENKAGGEAGGSFASQAISTFKKPALYIYFLAMFMTVFDGMLVVSAGDTVWKKYGQGYKDAAGNWGLKFSITNCIGTILLSAFLDLLMNRFKFKRNKCFAVTWGILGLFPLFIAIAFKSTNKEILFGILMSAMGVPFGLGLSQVPTLTFDSFPKCYGFAFGIVQIGSIIASTICMPIMLSLSKNGIFATFIITSIIQIVTCVFIFLHKQEYNSNNDSLTTTDTENYIQIA